MATIIPLSKGNTRLLLGPIRPSCNNAKHQLPLLHPSHLVLHSHTQRNHVAPMPQSISTISILPSSSMCPLLSTDSQSSLCHRRISAYVRHGFVFHFLKFQAVK